MRKDLEITRTEATAIECLSATALHGIGTPLSVQAGIFRMLYEGEKTWPGTTEDFSEMRKQCAVTGDYGPLLAEMPAAKYVVRALFERFGFECDRVD